jgi:phage tail protein X
VTITDKKVAGVPVVYLGGGFVAALALYAYHTKPASDQIGQDDATAGDNATEGDAGAAVTPSNTPFVANTQPINNSTAAGSPDTTPAFVQDTNTAWVQRATSWIVTGGIAGPADTQTALNKYVNGENLSFNEGKIRDAAVKQFGIPPEPIQPGGTERYAGPAVRQGTPPLTHTVKGTSDDTLAELSNLYYRTGSHDYIVTIYAANPGIPLAGSIPTGTKVRIPAVHHPRWYRARAGAINEWQIAAKVHSTPAAILGYNPGLKFPVKIGTQVRYY